MCQPRKGAWGSHYVISIKSYKVTVFLSNLFPLFFFELKSCCFLLTNLCFMVLTTYTPKIQTHFLSLSLSLSLSVHVCVCACVCVCVCLLLSHTYFSVRRSRFVVYGMVLEVSWAYEVALWGLWAIETPHFITTAEKNNNNAKLLCL